MLTVLAEQADQPADGNPYITALYESLRPYDITVAPLGRRELLHKHDIVHIHWPEQIVRWHAGAKTAALDVVKMLTAIQVAKWRGARLVWTGHDLGPHDMPLPRLYRIYIGLFGRQVDLMISLSDDATARLRERYGWLRRTRTVTVPHGHYRRIYPAPPAKAAAREQLGLPTDRRVFLLLGQIRRYKDVPGLVAAFGRTLPDAHLAVAGKVINDDSLAAEIQEAAAAAGNVTTRLERIPSAEVPAYHGAADVVVLPYATGTALHSGAAILALSMDRPVVVRDSGTMQELQRIAGKEWVRTFTGPTEDALRAAADLLDAPRGEASDLSELSWENVGRATAAAFYELKGQPLP